MKVDLKELGEALEPFLRVATSYTVDSHEDGFLLTLSDGKRMCAITPGDFRRLARAAAGLSDAPSPTQEHRGERVDQGAEGACALGEDRCVCFFLRSRCDHWRLAPPDTDRQRDEAVMADFAPAGDGEGENHE